MAGQIEPSLPWGACGESQYDMAVARRLGTRARSPLDRIQDLLFAKALAAPGPRD